MAVLEQELRTFRERRDEFLVRGEGKFVLIHENKEYGIFDTENDALQEGIKRFGLGPFLVNQILRFETPLNLVSHHLAI